jgi:hypothetical protein
LFLQVEIKTRIIPLSTGELPIGEKLYCVRGFKKP